MLIVFSRNGFTRNGRFIFISLLMSAITFLSGCEANLDLSAVEDSKKNPIARYDHYQAIAKSDKSIVVIGNRGALLTSVDQGVSWTRQVLPGDQSISYPTLLDIDICPDNRFIVLDANRKVWISDAEGGNWVAKNITTEEEVLDLTCALDGTIWVVGSFTLIMDSHDGGNSWTDKSIAEDAMFSRIQFIDRQNGVVTGEFGSVYKTTDGGETWKAANMIPNEFYPMASLFITTEEGWVGGLQGIIFHTNDGGQNWHRQETGTKAPIYNIFDVAGEIYAIGEQGTLLTLAGNGWRSVEINLGFGYLRGALALSNGKFLVVGGGGLIRLLDQHKL